MVCTELYFCMILNSLYYVSHDKVKMYLVQRY